MKLNRQTKYFINGVVLIILALFCVTFLPPLIKSKTSLIVQNYLYFEVEFFLLALSAIFFLFSPKYYKEQVLVILLGVLYYSDLGSLVIRSFNAWRGDLS